MVGAVDLEGLAATLRASRGLAAKRDIASVAARLGISGDSARPGRRRLRRDPGRRRLSAVRHRRLHERVRRRRPVVRRLVRRHGQRLRRRRHGRAADRGGRCGLGSWRRRGRSRCWPGCAKRRERFGVPVVGGHTNTRTDRGQLSVAILGRAKRLLTSLRCAARRHAWSRRSTCAVATASRSRTGRPPPTRPPSGCAPTSASCRPLPRPVLRVPRRTSSQGGIIGTAMMLRGMLGRRVQDRRRGGAEAGGRAARTMAADLSELRLSVGCFARERSRGGREAFASAASPRRTSAR